MTKEEWEESEEIYLIRTIDQMGLINVTKQKISLRCRVRINYQKMVCIPRREGSLF